MEPSSLQGSAVAPQGIQEPGSIGRGGFSKRNRTCARIFHDLLGFPKTHHWVQDLAHGRRSIPAGKTRKHAWPRRFWSDTPTCHACPQPRRRHQPIRGVPRPLEGPVAPLTAAKSRWGSGSVLTTQAPLGRPAGPLKDPQSHPARGKGLPTLRPHGRLEQHQGESGDPAEP